MPADVDGRRSLLNIFSTYRMPSRKAGNRHRQARNWDDLALQELPLTIDDGQPLPAAVSAFLADSKQLMQSFWDQWLERPIEQYVACDFEYVWHAMGGLVEGDWLQGRSFVEWGAGFGVVTGLAWFHGLAAIGIEAEDFLVNRGRELFKRHAVGAELWHGNFLPADVDWLVQSQANHPSLYHRVASAYETQSMQIDDFAMIFAYPWPGEEHFQREVFRHFAREGAILLMFRGPYQIEAYRKGGSDQPRL
jgi:hypothetical protein